MGVWVNIRILFMIILIILLFFWCGWDNLFLGILIVLGFFLVNNLFGFICLWIIIFFKINVVKFIMFLILKCVRDVYNFVILGFLIIFKLCFKFGCNKMIFELFLLESSFL